MLLRTTLTSMLGLGFIALAFLTIVSQDACAKQIGIWLFDEGSGEIVKDSSGNGLDGQIVGAPQWVDGRFGSALQFDGVDDYVEIPFNELLNIKHMTLMAWAFAPDDQNRVIIHRWAPPAYTLEFYQTKTTPVISTSAGVNFNKPDVTIITGEWFHVAGTYDGQKLIAYQNGEKINELDHSGDIDTGDCVVRFAARTDNDSGRFNGIIDEVAIFDESLTQEKIQNIMNNGLMSTTAVKPLQKMSITWATIKMR